MKCPFKFRLMPFEGGQGCDPECAWRRGGSCAAEPVDALDASAAGRERGTFELKVKLSDGAPLPRYARQGDAGMDLTSRETVTLFPGQTKMVGTGVSVEIPEGYFGMVVPRSGLGSKGVNLSNCVGVIDSGYRGEIKAPLHNNKPSVESRNGTAYSARFNEDGKMTVKRGDRVCQLIVVPYATCEVVEVDELSGSERGEMGFGSSGRDAL